MRALIVDDERLARVELRRLLRVHAQVEIVGEARNGVEALGLISELSPDLLFLDIQMPGMTGFDLLSLLEEDIPQVIFTTAFDEHAIKAFEVNALDYLLKPIAPERLAAAIRRTGPASARKSLARVFVRDGERCWIVPASEIFLVESEDNYARLHFAKERPLIRRSLNTLERQLDPTVFFRVNRKQIVNLAWIQKASFEMNDGLTVLLRSGQTVEVSRRRSVHLRFALRL